MPLLEPGRLAEICLAMGQLALQLLEKRGVSSQGLQPLPGDTLQNAPGIFRGRPELRIHGTPEKISAMVPVPAHIKGQFCQAGKGLWQSSRQITFRIHIPSTLHFLDPLGGFFMITILGFSRLKPHLCFFFRAPSFRAACPFSHLFFAALLWRGGRLFPAPPRQRPKRPL
jgi:hypothetical protein